MSSQTVTVTQTKANGNNKTLVSNKKVGVSARLPNGRIVNLSSNEYRNYMAKKNQTKNNNRTPNRNTMRKIQGSALNRRSTGDLRQQLVSTYLTFAYEMRPGLERKIFKKYLVLIMYSIDKIAGSSNNSERYSKLYEEAESLTGTVNLSVQNKCAEIITSILENISKIDSSTSKKLDSLMNF
jgi:hypothetical protein